MLGAIKSRALLATRFESLEDFSSRVQITYYTRKTTSDHTETAVHLHYTDNGQTIFTELTSGISQNDILAIKNAPTIEKAQFVIETPYAVKNRADLAKIYMLARRRPLLYGAGDAAFYDLAEATLNNIITPELAFINKRDRSEKGYINTFNHITAQVIITSIFSEELADFLGDVHERFYMPELTTGKFTSEQLTDTINYPTDNYVDLVNNTIGQEIGKILKEKYDINSNTHWTPELLASFLNEIQIYYMYSFEIGLKPFKTQDKLIIKYAKKINRVLAGNYQNY